MILRDNGKEILPTVHVVREGVPEGVPEVVPDTWTVRSWLRFIASFRHEAFNTVTELQ